MPFVKIYDQQQSNGRDDQILHMKYLKTDMKKPNRRQLNVISRHHLFPFLCYLVFRFKTRAVHLNIIFETHRTQKCMTFFRSEYELHEII